MMARKIWPRNSSLSTTMHSKKIGGENGGQGDQRLATSLSRVEIDHEIMNTGGAQTSDL